MVMEHFNGIFFHKFKVAYVDKQCVRYKIIIIRRLVIYFLITSIFMEFVLLSILQNIFVALTQSLHNFCSQRSLSEVSCKVPNCPYVILLFNANMSMGCMYFILFAHFYFIYYSQVSSVRTKFPFRSIFLRIGYEIFEDRSKRFSVKKSASSMSSGYTL